MSIESIRERLEALAEDSGWTTMPSDVLVGLVHVVGGDGDGIALVHGNAAHLATPEDRAAFIAHARADIPPLLAVAEAAARMKEHHGGIACAETASWSDECEAAHEPLRAALAALEAQP